MSWDLDIDYSIRKKSSIKQGRRARADEELENSLENDVLPIKPRSGKWADDGIKSAGKSGTTNLIEQERFLGQRQDDSDDDIPIIPDIDDIQDEVLGLHDIKAENISVKTSTYKALDSELENLHKDSKLAHVGNLDLSFLTNRLQLNNNYARKDEVWSMESLHENLINFKT